MQQILRLPKDDPDDTELVCRACAREEAALRTIMQRHNRRLFHISRGILLSDSEAEDVVQETYVRAFTQLETFRGNSSLGTWLVRIAMNEALGRQRRARPTVSWTDAEAERHDASIVSETPERTAARREIRHLVEAAIDALPERYRLVLVTRVIEGMSVDEAASVLGLSAEAVKTQLHRARAMLREALEKHLGAIMLDAFPFEGARCERLTASVLRRLGARSTISL